jgi:hypothetical protein
MDGEATMVRLGAAGERERFVGLTDRPERCLSDLGRPSDLVLFPFNYESHARGWVERLRRGGFRGCPGADGGWRFGYIYSGRAPRRG